MQLVNLNFFGGDSRRGERGVLSNPARGPTSSLDNVDVVVGIGERLGCRAFNALYGSRVDGVSAAEQDETAVEQLARAATAVPAHRRLGAGRTAVSGPPAIRCRTAADALAVVHRVREQAGAGDVAIAGATCTTSRSTATTWTR